MSVLANLHDAHRNYQKKKTTSVQGCSDKPLSILVETGLRLSMKAMKVIDRERKSIAPSEGELAENTDRAHPKFLKKFPVPKEILPLQKQQKDAYE